MIRKANLQQLISSKTRLLQQLERQKALQGQNITQETVLDIQILEAELAVLQAELAAAGDEEPLVTPGAGSPPAPTTGPTQIGSVNFSHISEGQLQIEGDITTHTSAGGDIVGGDKQVIHTGGGSYIEGNINTEGGDFVGRDKITTQGMATPEVAHLFEQIYAYLEIHPGLSSEDKIDLRSEVQELYRLVTARSGVDEAILARRLRHIRRIAPDMLDLVVARLRNPAASFGVIVARVARSNFGF